MNTKSAPLANYVKVDASAARMARLWTSVSQRLSSKTPLYRRRPVLAMVATAGLLLGAGAGYSWMTWLGPAGSSRGITVLQTASDRLTVELGKGITLRLAAHSRVQMLPRNDSRVSIRLEHGSITSDLQPGNPRRFSVLVDDLEIRDTGTRFIVSRDASSGQVDVSVERGSVEISGGIGQRDAKSISAGERWTRQGRPTIVEQSGVAAEPQTGSATPNTPLAPPAGSSTATTSNALREQPAPLSNVHEPLEHPSAQALFEQANVARRAGDPGSASQALQILIARYPNDTRVGLAALELGRLRMSALSDLPGAVRAFQTALDRAPSAGFREDALAHLIGAHSALGNTAQCHTLRQKYLNEYPTGVHRTSVERNCGGR